MAGSIKTMGKSNTAQHASEAGKALGKLGIAKKKAIKAGLTGEHATVREDLMKSFGRIAKK